MGRAGKILLLLAFIAYPVMLHLVVSNEGVRASHLLLVFAPLLAVLGWMALRSVGKKWWPLVVLGMAAFVYYIATGDYGRIGLVVVNGLSHATLNLFLLWLFGRTLLPGREPLILQITRHINGEVPPEIVVYARQVTVAWSVYFAAQVAVSALLYGFASIAVWSFFINVLNLPLLASMFLAEYAYRTAHFPDHPRTSIMKAIEVYTKDFAAPKKADRER